VQVGEDRACEAYFFTSQVHKYWAFALFPHQPWKYDIEKCPRDWTDVMLHNCTVVEPWVGLELLALLSHCWDHRGRLVNVSFEQVKLVLIVPLLIPSLTRSLIMYL
jgi:hypothetical protein